MTSTPLFDQYADDYEKALARGISFSGESREYFARKRVEKTAECMYGKLSARRILDFGCGTGDTLPMLVQALGAESGLGVDVSAKSIELAAKRHQSSSCVFSTMDACREENTFDLAYCNGVFHHIPPEGRHSALAYVHGKLKPGGYFAFWENNPWNPGTRLAMRRTPFDRDAITISPPAARRLLTGAGFYIVETVSMFVFPKALNWLRFMERVILIAPIGAQYLVLTRKKFE